MSVNYIGNSVKRFCLADGSIQKLCFGCTSVWSATACEFGGSGLQAVWLMHEALCLRSLMHKTFAERAQNSRKINSSCEETMGPKTKTISPKLFPETHPACTAQAPPAAPVSGFFAACTVKEGALIIRIRCWPY